MTSKKLTLGKVISSRREEMNLGVRELARDVKLDHSTIVRIENTPDIVADPRTLKKISERLKLDYNYLLSLNNTIDDQPDVRAIARASTKMSPADRDRMMDLLRNEFADAFSDDNDGFDPKAPRNF